MTTDKGVWGLQQVRDKQLQDLWTYSGSSGLFVMGENGYGSLNQNDTVRRSSPVQVPGTTWDMDDVNIDENGFIGRKTDGTLWMSGSAGRGKLGNNDENTNYSSPIQIPGTNWSNIMYHSPIGSSAGAFRTGGQLWMWGFNNGGQLGINEGPGGNGGSYSSPVQVPGTTWSSGVSSNGITGAIKSDGTMWMWGFGNNGALAQNNTSQYSSPAQIPGTTWSIIQSSSQSSGAVKTDGTMWAWGQNNTYGAGGLNNRIRYSSPVQIPGTTWGTGKGKFSKGHLNTSAIKTDGTLWVWGAGWYGAAGQNNTVHYSSPVQVPGTTWNRVSSGTYATFATKTDGTIWAWGYNNFGQLGHNDRVNYSSPVQVPGTWGAFVMGGQNGSSVFEANL